MNTRTWMAVLAALTCPGCITVDYVATDGQVFRETGASVGTDLAIRAVTASAARDLACPAAQITAHALPGGDLVADGCGKRATYRWVREGSPWSHLVYHPILMSRFSLDPAR